MEAEGSFREQVRQLVAQGKLTPEEAEALLGSRLRPEEVAPEEVPPEAVLAGEVPPEAVLAGEVAAPTPPQAPDAPIPEAPVPPEAPAPPASFEMVPNSPTQAIMQVADSSAVPPKLVLQVAGYSLTVHTDAAVSAPSLSASIEGRLELLGTPEGWLLRRTPVSWQLGGEGSMEGRPGSLDAAGRWVERVVGNLLQEGTLRADLIVPAGITSVSAKVQGGNLSLPDFEASVNVTVQGGNLSLGHATELRAKVQGGNLKWNATVEGGDHVLKVQGGNVNVNLGHGSSLRLDGEVTAGNMSASGFEVTRQTRDFVNASYSGVLGGGRANLALRVQGGNARVVVA